MKDRLTTLRSHWNARKASGTRLGAIGTARRAILYCSLAGDIISGGERFLFLGSPKSFARMGRGGMMERYISIYRNLLAKPSPTIRASSDCECKGTAFLAFGQ